MGLLDFLNPLNAITGALTKAYEAKLAAGNNAERIAADVEISALKSKRDAVIALASEPWWTPRSIMGYAVAILVVKLVVWDSAFGLGVTPPVGNFVTWICVTIIGFYFVSKSADSIAHVIGTAISRKSQ
jgi:hypothetical protein